MQKKTKVELGIIGVCAALLGGSTIAVNVANKGKTESNVPAPSSSYVEQTTTTSDNFSEIVAPATSSTTQSAAATTANTNAEPAPEESAAATTISEKKVYIAASGEGTKYHRRSDCSGMTDAVEITLSDAEARGYTPCKRCN